MTKILLVFLLLMGELVFLLFSLGNDQLHLNDVVVVWLMSCGLATTAVMLTKARRDGATNRNVRRGATRNNSPRLARDSTDKEAQSFRPEMQNSVNPKKDSEKSEKEACKEPKHQGGTVGKPDTRQIALPLAIKEITRRPLKAHFSPIPPPPIHQGGQPSIDKSEPPRRQNTEPATSDSLDLAIYPSRERAVAVAPPKTIDLPETPPSPVGPTQTGGQASPAHRVCSSKRAKIELSPADYERNAGRPGFLYLARNSEHWTALFKIGQTLNAERRIDRLNEEHANVPDLGFFKLLVTVPVSDAYNAEKIIFKVLDELRPVPGREFFIANEDFLLEALQAAAEFVDGEPVRLNKLYEELDPMQHPPQPSYPQRYTYKKNDSVGWIFFARNRFHQKNTYRFAATKETPEQAIKKWNHSQRTCTSKIGFYVIVFALPVWDSVQSRALGWEAISRWKIKGTRSFVRGPLTELAEALIHGLERS